MQPPSTHYSTSSLRPSAHYTNGASYESAPYGGMAGMMPPSTHCVNGASYESAPYGGTATAYGGTATSPYGGAATAAYGGSATSPYGGAATAAYGGTATAFGGTATRPVAEHSSVPGGLAGVAAAERRLGGGGDGLGAEYGLQDPQLDMSTISGATLHEATPGARSYSTAGSRGAPHLSEPMGATSGGRPESGGYRPRPVEGGYEGAASATRAFHSRHREDLLRDAALREAYREQPPPHEPSRGYEVASDYRSPAGGGEYAVGTPVTREYRELSAQQYRDLVEYPQVSEAAREAAYNFPRDGSFVAEPYSGGAPMYGSSQRSYPSAAPPQHGYYGERYHRDERSTSPMQHRPSSPMYSGGNYASVYGGPAGYGEASYSRDPRAYGYGGYSANAYASAAGYDRGGGPQYGGYAGSSSYGQGDTYSGGVLSFGPPPGRPPPQGGGGYGGFGASGGAMYGFPTTGSFVADPFAPGAPPLGGPSRPNSYLPPAGSYGGFGEGLPGYGHVSPQFGGAGAPSPFPPTTASFLAMPDPAASFAGASLGLGTPSGGTGGLGAASSFTQSLGGGFGGTPGTGMSAPGTSPADPVGGSLLSGGAAQVKPTSDAAGDRKPPSRSATSGGVERPARPAIPMTPSRSKKRGGRMGCC